MAFDPLSNLFQLAGTVIDKIFPDKTEADKAKVRMAELAMQGQLEDLKAQVSLLLGQMNVNVEEAKHASWIVAGWRPSVGWVCAAAFGWTFVLGPFAYWILKVCGHDIALPALDMSHLMTVLLGILGLGVYRTYEKTRNGGK